MKKTSAGEMFRNLRKVLVTGHSAEYPVGGWKPIHRALVDTIAKRGSIITGTRVESVVFSGRRAVGIKAGGKIHRADRVVINAPVQQAASLIPAKLLEKGYAARCRKLVPTSGVFVDAALDSAVFDLDGLIYTTKPAATDAHLQPFYENCTEGKQLITMFLPDFTRGHERQGNGPQGAQGEWARCGAFSGIEKACLEAVCAIPITRRGPGEHRPDRGHAPRRARSGLEGVYLVGDSVAARGQARVGNESCFWPIRPLPEEAVG